GQPRHSGADYNDIGLNHKEMDAIVSRIDCQFQTAPWFRIRSVSAFGNEEDPRRSAAGANEAKVANGSTGMPKIYAANSSSLTSRSLGWIGLEIISQFFPD